jgi:hypothetical protein
MQFDGASHGGYVTLNRMDEATEELRREGVSRRATSSPLMAGLSAVRTRQTYGYRSLERAIGRMVGRACGGGSWTLIQELSLLT